MVPLTHTSPGTVPSLNSSARCNFDYTQWKIIKQMRKNCRPLKSDTHADRRRQLVTLPLQKLAESASHTVWMLAVHKFVYIKWKGGRVHKHSHSWNCFPHKNFWNVVLPNTPSSPPLLSLPLQSARDHCTSVFPCRLSFHQCPKFIKWKKQGYMLTFWRRNYFF